MSHPPCLSAAEIHQALAALAPWQQAENALVWTGEFPDFLGAIAFVNAVAHLAERQDHHPDIDIRYRTVTLRYWTHVSDGITERDLVAAREVNTFAGAFLKPVTID